MSSAGSISDNKIIQSDDNYIVYLKDPGEDSETLPGNPIGRLDKPVGGLMLLSKKGSSTSSTKIAPAFSKTYIAVVAGSFAPCEQQGIYKDLLLHDRRRNKSFPVKSMRKGVREASLEYNVIGYDQENDLSLVMVRLHTGRTHQIRVQFASRRHPLAGDGKYGSRIKGLPALFAYKLELEDIDSGESKTYIELPGDVYPWNLFTRELSLLR